MRKVAVVATSFRLPGTTPARFWDDLLAGRDLVSEVDSSRWATTPYLHPDKAHPGTAYTFAAGSIGDVSGFDAGFFALSPREAALMDPQQRLLLEMAWEAFENANLPPSALRGSDCGVYIGIATSDYSWRLAGDLGAIDTSFATGNTASIAANRLSYAFDLRGPSMAIDTACSSALVAFHQACRAISSGEVTHALAGAVSLHLHPVGFVSFSKAGMLSRQGRCRVFDASADGYVRSEGGGVFLLKDLEQAIADGDPILAVVAHTAVNTDGHKAGLAVPSCSAQADLLTRAYAQAGIEPWEIDYIETHGTGTPVGDPIETRALGEALGARRPKERPLLIGSVKGNLGHLEAAAGVAGLVKALYCLTHRVIPVHVGMDTPNPHIPFADLNLEVPAAHTPLHPTDRLVIGVNSFGFGGANAHAILQSPTLEPIKAPSIPKATALPILLSARSADGLKAAAHDMASYLASQPRSALYDISYQSVFGREAHPHRAVVFGSRPEILATALEGFARGDASGAVECGKALQAPMGAAFIYSGNGSQWVGMGRRLLADPVFLAAVREVDELFGRYADYSIEAQFEGNGGEGRYHLTEVAQPALFALQVGITAMLRHRGVVPMSVAGHSVGEVAAAWAAGALSLAAAVNLIYHRSALQGTTRGWGSMAAVGLGEQAVQSLLRELDLAERLEVASINSGRGSTIAGDCLSLDRLESALEARGIVHKRLDLDYAFHSAAMDGLSPELHRALAHLEPSDWTIPLISTVTGKRIAGQALDADYWWRNIREPVQFERAIKTQVADGINIFVEIGPHPALRRHILDCLADLNVQGCVIGSGERGDDAPSRIHSSASRALIAGATMEWERVFPWRGRHVRLPNYPWQREHHWHPLTPASIGELERKFEHPLLGYGLRQFEHTWESAIDTQRLPFLADHVIGGATVFPGTGYVELTLSIAARAQPGTVYAIEDLEIRASMMIGAAPSRTLRSSFDPRDGQLSVKSREQQSSEWTLHLTGRVMSQAADLSASRCELPDRLEDFGGADHAERTLLAGLDYGPCFQTIESGWIEGSTVLAALFVPDALQSDFEQYLLHPSLLDCTFQLIIELIGSDAAKYQGVTFVPTRVGRLCYRAGRGRPRYARARLLRRGPHSLLGQFELFDETLQPIALLEEVRFQGVRLQHHGAAEPLRYLDYVAVARPPAPAPADLAGLSEALERCFPQDSSAEARKYAAEVEPLLDELCTCFAIEALSRADTIADEVKRYHAHLSAWAEAAGLLDGGGTPQATAQDIWNSLLGDYPDYFPIVHAAGRVGLHLPALLEGRERLADILGEAAWRPLLLRQTLGANLVREMGEALQQVIGAALSRYPEGQRLGVLEISGGGPTLGTALCRDLDFDRCDYCFIGNGTDSQEEARRLKERYPAIDLLDLSEPHRDADCQLAILWLDFKSPSEAEQALDCARARLVDGGSLVMIGQHPSRWLDFVFGSDPSWCYGEELWHGGARPHGFSPGRSLKNSADCGPYLIVAGRQSTVDRTEPALSPRPTAAVARHWLLLTEEAGFGARLAPRLAEHLRRSGAPVTTAPASPVVIEAALEAEPGVPLGMLYLGGLSSQPSNASAEARLEAQVACCAEAALLARACESAPDGSLFGIVTAQTAIHLLPRRVIAREGCTPACAESSAALGGLARTLMNELSNCAVRLVDVETEGADADLVAAALAREILLGGDEQEVILSARGERFAPRLRSAPAPLDDRPASTEDSYVARLKFSVPGQLRNLRWERERRASPSPGQVEVGVRATGVNFRDVMYALGLLSDEAVESGFAGPSLGLEFAGEITRIGSGTGEFVPGDRVLGFAPSSFSDHVLTDTGALARMPDGLSFEAAATLPSAFFTAYYALHHLARLIEGEKVLIHGAAGGVGMAAIQIAKWCGAEVYATAGTEVKRDFLRLLGVDHIFDSRSLSFADQILEQTEGRGVDVVLNSLAGEAINRNLKVLKPFGRFLELGKRDFYENTRVGLRPFRRNLSYFGIDADQLMSERPELTQRLFGEVLDLFRAGTLKPLPYRAFDAADVIDVFRDMQQSRHIGKLIVTYPHGIPAAEAPRSTVRGDFEVSSLATYLVTGGLSGFGLRTAAWLAERGARSLVLIGRRGPESVEAHTEIARLERRGVRVAARACDVTDRTALEALLAEIQRELPPLRGVVHAAMVIEDGLVRDVSASELHRVLAPKVLGAQLLHEATLGLPLDFFVLYSSATTLFGNPGQGSYVAANCALEALARSRHAAGLPATCILWGAIDDVGYLARNSKFKEALEDRMGGAALASSAALGVLEEMLITGRSRLAVLNYDWRSLQRFLPSAGSAKFAELARETGDDDMPQDGQRDLRELLSQLTPQELEAKVTEVMKIEIGDILRMPIEKIEEHLPLHQMGLDSLMGVELAVALESRFGIRPPVLLLSDAPTVSKLAGWLIAQLKADAPTAADEVRAEVERLAQQHASEVPQEELDLIAAELAATHAMPRRMIY